MLHRKQLLPVALLAALALASLSCGDSDKGGPSGNNNPPDGDDFDQATAVATSQTSAAQAAALVQSMTSLAAGVGKDARTEGYGWNEETQQWEWHYEWEQTGYTYIWDYAVQYLDASGDPLESGTGAASLKHTLEGTGHYAANQGGADIVYDYDYDYNTLITGIGTGELNMTGDGGQTIDYNYVYGNVNYDYNYVVDWAIDEGGIVVTEERAGCPTGTIHYDLEPYSMDIVFDGDASAPYTLYDSDDDVVPAGSGSTPLQCTN